MKPGLSSEAGRRRLGTATAAMGKGEVSWKTKFADGRKRQVYAKYVRRDWQFFEREKRFERWELVAQPSLEDWQALLDAVERRVQRRLIPFDEMARIKNRIRERFPESAESEDS